jgi:transcription elongation factor GreA-like protein
VPAILEFDKLRRDTRGFVVYHGAGWGEATVEDFAAATEEVAIKFATGRRESFPLDTLLSRFKALDADDLRAMKLQRMDALRDEATNDPSGLIRRTATLYRGTITSLQVKSELCGSVVTDKEWTGFWKRAKAAAAKDPWLKVEGSTTRPVFVVRDKRGGRHRCRRRAGVGCGAGGGGGESGPVRAGRRRRERGVPADALVRRGVRGTRARGPRR